MSNQLATQSKPKNALMALSERLSISPEKLQETLKKTVFKNCKTDEEFAVMVAVSNEYDLNPLTKQIYAFPAKGGGVEPIVSIDGWLKIINSQNDFDGMTVTMNDDFSEATCEIHVKGRSHPTVITEYLEECQRPTDPWKTMPKRMLRHKSIIQCGRVAFGICGIYDEDEGKEVVMRDVTPQGGAVEKPEKIAPFEKPVTATSELPVSSPQSPVQEGVEKSNSESDAAQLPPDTYRVFISEVEAKPWEKNGKSGTYYLITLSGEKSSRKVTTFSSRLGKMAQEATSSWAYATLEKTEKGITLKDLTLEFPVTEIVDDGGIA